MRGNHIVPKERPTCDDLWDQYFKVKMLFLHSRDVNKLRKYGVRVSGVEDIDKTMDKEEIVTELNIDAMFEKYRKGVTIRVLNYNDTAKIYEIIHSHLVACAEYLSYGVNVGNLPLKDLIELDEFASVVYDKAKSVFSQEERNLAISSNFANVQTLNFNNILNRSRSTSPGVKKTSIQGIEVSTANEAPVAPVFRERNSMKEIFTTEITRLEGWRGKIDGQHNEQF